MPDSAMLPHTFSHDGATYVVSFKPNEDQWRAALYKRDDGSITELGPIAVEDLSGLSEHAIRAGYIGLAEWLVKGRADKQVVRCGDDLEEARLLQGRSVTGPCSVWSPPSSGRSSASC